MPFVAVITGGGTGIGRAQAIALSQVEDGAVVIITGRRLGPLEETRRLIGLDRCHIVSDCDVGSTEAWSRIATKVQEVNEGRLHFLANTAGAVGPALVPYESMEPGDIQAYNASYITGSQLAYHYMAPFLIRGSQDRGVPSVVMEMSSLAAFLSRGKTSRLPLYVTSKAAKMAITRTACGMYKDIVSYGINPYAYLTDMLRGGCEILGVTVEQYSARMNPFPEPGDPKDIGFFSAAAARGEATGLESGVSYGMFPVPIKYRDENDLERSGSILYSVASVHGDDLDSLDYGATIHALTKISRAFYSNGKPVPESTLRKLVEEIDEIRRTSVHSPMTK